MPVFEITDNVTGVILDAEGESEPNEQEKAQIFQDYYAENPQEATQVPQAPTPAPILSGVTQGVPQRREGDLGFLGAVRGTAELAGSLGAAIIAEPIAGLAGIAGGILPGEPGQAEEVVKAVRGIVPAPGEAGQRVGQRIGEALGDVAEFAGPVIGDFFKFIGQGFEDLKEATFAKFGAAAATAVAIAPTAILEAVPALAAIKKARNIPTTIADDVIDQVGDEARLAGASSIKTGIPPEIKTQAQISADLRSGGKKATARVVEEVKPIPEIMASAEALGVDLNPSHYSSNRAFIEVERALASRPGSKLNTIEEKAIIDTGEAADTLIKDLGGTLDKSLLDANVRGDIEKNIAALNKQSDIAYADVNKAIDRRTKVNPSASSGYIAARLDELGGDKTLLLKSEKRLLKFAEDAKNPTYGALDQTRREVGEALGKQSGEFRNDTEGVLKQVYAVLSDDQQGIADIAGVGAQYQAGRKLVEQRKNLEKVALDLFGRELAGSILPKLATAAGKLTKGDVSGFRKLMNAIPKNRRQEAAATMLNEFFASGTRKKGAIGGGFVSAFASLNRNAAAKREIFKHLPPGAEKRFDDIGRVTTGIFRSKALENKSKTARDLIAALDDSSLIGRLFRGAAAEAAGTSVGIPTGLVTGGRFLTGELFKKGKKATAEADALLTSPVFKKAIEDAAAGKPGAGEGIKQTGVFKRWLTAQPPNIRAEIAAIGFISYLTGDIDATMTFTEPQVENR